MDTNLAETIVVTGMGCISALGKSVAEYSSNLFAGTNGAGKVSLFSNDLSRIRVAAEVKNFIPSEHFNVRKTLPYMDRFTQFAVYSARQAAQQANINETPGLGQSTAVVFGTGVGGQETQDHNFYRLYAEQAVRLHPTTVPKLIPSAAASHISVDLHLTGPTICTASACSASGHALVIGAMMIQTGQCERALCGGSEAPINFGCMKAWEGMRVLTPNVCSPFSLGREGVLLGEGGACLVLESLQSATKRGAVVLAELVGYGMSSDATGFVAPDIRGPISAMRKALQHAELEPEAIGHINAHGSGTAQNDSVESQAIRQVFGQHAVKIAVCSTKSMHGHLLGAASAIEAIAAIEALNLQYSPPTINYTGIDPACDLDYVPNESRKISTDYAMSNSFAFGGLNTSLVFRRIQSS